MNDSPTSRFAAICTIAIATALAPMPPALADAQLHIEDLGEGFAFRLGGSVEGSPWVIQHSLDGERWQDLAFLKGDGEGGTPPSVEIPRGILAQPGAQRGLFRARQLAEDSPVLRRLLAERAKWRLLGIGDYDYELRQSFGMVSWHGTVTVAGGEVAAFETIDMWPPVVEPDIPTVEDLFDRVASAVAQDAEVIDVTWDPVFGLPSTCYIDISSLIADEERGWTVLAFDR